MSVYLNIAGLQQSPGKRLGGPGKVLEFFVSKREETVLVKTVLFAPMAPGGHYRLFAL